MIKISSVPAYSFGKSKFVTHEPQTPGPGAYPLADHPLDTLKDKFHAIIPKAAPSRKEEALNGIGPGAYEVSPPTRRPPGHFFSLAGLTSHKSPNSTPGPGHYKYEQVLNKLKSNSPSVTIARALDSHRSIGSSGPPDSCWMTFRLWQRRRKSCMS